jgi:hypothetical protein
MVNDVGLGFGPARASISRQQMGGNTMPDIACALPPKRVPKGDVRGV